MDAGTVLALAQKELRDARRNRWFLLYGAAFAGLALLLAWTALAGAGAYGAAGFARTAASLINLALLVVPLMGLTLGALALAGERERGTLLYLMAQPVTALEVVVGKYLGLAAALTAALALGFGLSGAVLAWQGGVAGVASFLALAGLTLLLGLAALGLGFLLSAAVRRGATAVGLALLLWLLLAFLSDLGVMGTALVLRLGVEELLAAALVNPLQVFKMAATLATRSSLEVLGAAGVYAVRTYGDALMALLLALLAAWALAPLALAWLVCRRQGAV